MKTIFRIIFGVMMLGQIAFATEMPSFGRVSLEEHLRITKEGEVSAGIRITLDDLPRIATALDRTNLDRVRSVMVTFWDKGIDKDLAQFLKELSRVEVLICYSTDQQSMNDLVKIAGGLSCLEAIHIYGATSVQPGNLRILPESLTSLNLYGFKKKNSARSSISLEAIS